VKLRIVVDPDANSRLYEELKNLSPLRKGERIRQLAQLGLLVEQGKFPMFMPDQAAEQSLQAASEPQDNSDLKRRLASKLEGKF